MSRDTEVFETFCRFCFSKFEKKKTLAEALKAADDHEFACPNRACALAPAVKAA
jgi:hypothetical protein